MKEVTEMENIKDYIRGIDEKAERRFITNMLSFDEIETNGIKSKDENTIVGYAAVFNKDSEDFGGWVERIAPGAFDGVLEDDAVALFNHNMNLVLGRNKVNVTLGVDENGLKYRVSMPDTSLGRDIKELVKSGIINKSSFAFTVAEETFTKGDPSKGMPHVRTITKMERLYDVSPVTMPAYPDTSVASRSLDKATKEPSKEERKEEGMKQIGKSLLEIRLLYNINKHRKFNI
jgi:HK97 family phage prohead protease